MAEAAADKRTLIALDDVAIRRGGRIVVEGVTFALEKGECCVLRGANGSGKTSLLRAIAGFAHPAAGRITRDLKTGAAFLGHADGVKAALTGAENLRFWAALYGAPQNLLDKAVDALGVRAFLAQRAGTLSAGQRRRLALCRIVASMRDLWILDEPTAGMDAKSIAAVLGLIELHRSEGGGVIVATHEPLDIRDARTMTLSGAFVDAAA